MNMVLWRSGYAAVCKTAYTGSIPVGTSKKIESASFHFFVRCLFSLRSRHSKKIESASCPITSFRFACYTRFAHVTPKKSKAQAFIFLFGASFRESTYSTQLRLYQSRNDICNQDTSHAFWRTAPWLLCLARAHWSQKLGRRWRFWVCHRRRSRASG